VADSKGNGVLKQLRDEGEKRGLSSRFIEFYQKLFDIQARGEQQIGEVNPGLKKELIDERLVRGRPLINYNDITLDWALLNNLFVDIIKVFTEYEDLFGRLPESLTRPRPRKVIPRGLVRAWFKGTKLPASMITDNIEEHLLLEAITHATLKPYLVSYAKAFSGLINNERWRRNTCPVCGGKPDFSYLDREKSSRWLVCSRCDTSWLFQRIECPFCGNQEQTDLTIFSDEDGLYRLYACDKCHKYIKTIDLRATNKHIMFPAERVLTLAMDVQAQAEGYEPGNS
jgi:transcription elongation factor Elf1